MSNFGLIFLLVGLLTLLGTTVLVLVTVKYYWGERGAPPATGDDRRRQHEEELRLRAKQIEYSESHPNVARKPDFFDNTKSQ